MKNSVRCWAWFFLSATSWVLFPSFCASLAIPWARHAEFWTLKSLALAFLFVGGMAWAFVAVRRLLAVYSCARLAWGILAVTFGLRTLLILGHTGYEQSADCLSYYDFVSQMAKGGLCYANLALLSRIWDYQLWLGRAFPLSISLAWLLGEEHLLGAQMLNAVLSTATSGLLYLIGRKLMSARPALFALMLWSFSPITYALNLDYTHQIQGAFWVVLGVWLLISFPVRSDSSIKKRVISLFLSVVFCLLMLQRGLDFLLWSIVLVHILWASLSGTLGGRRLASAAFYLVLVPAFFWGTTRAGFQRWSDHYNEARLGSGLASIIVHGWNDSIGGEYYSFYEQVDRLTPVENKQAAAFRIIASKVVHEPFKTLGRLMLIKMTKFHMVGYASGIEQGLDSSGYKASSLVLKTVRLVYAPVLLASALAGLLVLLRRSRLGLRWLTLVMIPLLACLQFALLGQTSPRYSFYTQFALALLAGLAISSMGKKVTHQPFVQPLLRWALGGVAVMAVYVLACLCAYGAVQCAGGRILYLDLRRPPASGQNLATDHPTGALERNLFFSPGLVEEGDTEEYCVELPEQDAREVSFLLWQMGGTKEGAGLYRCEVFLNERLLESFELAPDPYFLRKAYPLESSRMAGRRLCIRLSYAGPPAMPVVDIKHPLRLGFVGLW